MAKQQVDALLVQASEAMTSGDTQRARALIKEILALDQQNAAAWLIATYLTNDPAQQRRFLDNAKKFAPESQDVRRRERQLFPPIAKGVFTPDPVQPSLPESFPKSRTTAGDHIPILADGVELSPISRSLAYLPWIMSVAGLMAAFLIIVSINTLFQNRLENTPSAIVLRLYPAVQARDNAALANILADEPKLLCGSDLVNCIQVSTELFANYVISGATLSPDGQSALVNLIIQFKGNQESRCQSFLVVNTNQGWRIQKDMSGGLVTCSPQRTAAVAIQPTLLSAATLDGTQQSIFQTSTKLSQTQNAMILAPTLTATFIAPMLTQTALLNRQNELNTAIAATATQGVILQTQTAEWVGEFTSTPFAKTQLAARATITAASYQSALQGTIVAAQNVKGQVTIMLFSANGSNITSLNRTGLDPIWSPDGRRIAYSKRTGGSALHIMNADGTNDIEITIPDAPLGNGWATWLPNGEHLLVEGEIRLALHALFLTSLDGKTITRLLNQDQSYYGSWTTISPDGKEVLYVSDDQLWVMSIAGGVPKALVKQIGARAPVWSRDGKHIVFDAGNDMNRGIYVADANGSNLKRITPPELYVALPTWSPNGSQIAALCYDNSVRNYKVCILNADGTNLTVVTKDGGFEGRISWK